MLAREYGLLEDEASRRRTKRIKPFGTVLKGINKTRAFPRKGIGIPQTPQPTTVGFHHFQAFFWVFVVVVVIVIIFILVFTRIKAQWQ